MRTLWLAAIMLTALTMGMGFCHLMEMPARITWDQSLWVGSTVTGGLYRMFGTLGAAIDLGAVGCSIALAVRSRGSPQFRLVAAGAALFTLALALWAAIVLPANLQLATWLGGTVPSDWTAVRARWETGHAVSSVLQIIGFGAIVRAALR